MVTQQRTLADDGRNGLLGRMLEVDYETHMRKGPQVLDDTVLHLLVVETLIGDGFLVEEITEV